MRFVELGRVSQYVATRRVYVGRTIVFVLHLRVFVPANQRIKVCMGRVVRWAEEDGKKRCEMKLQWERSYNVDERLDDTVDKRLHCNADKRPRLRTDRRNRRAGCRNKRPLHPPWHLHHPPPPTLSRPTRATEEGRRAAGQGAGVGQSGGCASAQGIGTLKREGGRRRRG